MRAVLARTMVAAGVVILAAAGCAAWDVYGAWPVPDGYSFPRHSIWGGGPTALFEGELSVVDGCILGTNTGGRATVVWPPGFSVSIEEGQPVVHGILHDARMGHVVTMVGGWYSTIPPTGRDIGSCPPPYFLTTGFAD